MTSKGVRIQLRKGELERCASFDFVLDMHAWLEPHALSMRAEDVCHLEELGRRAGKARVRPAQGRGHGAAVAAALTALAAVLSVWGPC